MIFTNNVLKIKNYLLMDLKFILLQLNEINFDLVDKYLFSSKKNKLKILNSKNSYKFFNAYSEKEYRN